MGHNTLEVAHVYYYVLKAHFLNCKEKTTLTLIALKLCMWEETESTHARICTMCRGQQQVKQQLFVPCIEDGKEVLNYCLYNFIINTEYQIHVYIFWSK